MMHVCTLMWCVILIDDAGHSLSSYIFLRVACRVLASRVRNFAFIIHFPFPCPCPAHPSRHVAVRA